MGSVCVENICLATIRHTKLWIEFWFVHCLLFMENLDICDLLRPAAVSKTMYFVCFCLVIFVCYSIVLFCCSLPIGVSLLNHATARSTVYASSLWSYIFHLYISPSVHTFIDGLWTFVSVHVTGIRHVDFTAARWFRRTWIRRSSWVARHRFRSSSSSSLRLQELVCVWVSEWLCVFY